MKDELHIFCKLEGVDERYLRFLINADRRLLKQEKKRNKSKERSGRECKSLEYSEELNEG